jgi:hypothetical protein
MKTSWEKTEGRKTHYVYVHYKEVVVGSHYGTGMSDNAGVCSHEEYLNGQFQGLIRDIFGSEILDQVTYAVLHTHENEDHNKHREEIKRLRKFITQFPIDPSLKEIKDDPGTFNGRTVYGNRGGYQSFIESDNTSFLYNSTKGEIIDKRDRTRIECTYHVHLSYCVAFHDYYYVIGGSNFYVMDPRGSFIFTTETIDKGCGYSLRFDNVLRHRETIAVYYWWFHKDYPDGLLSYENEKGFTSRYEFDDI